MSRRAAASTLLAGLALAVPAAAHAAPGALDPAFGTGGVFTETTPGSFDRLTRVAPAPDGSLLVVATDHGVRRHTAAGPRDLSYGGRTLKPSENGTTGIDRDLEVLADGSVLVAGSRTSTSAVARLTPAGALDAGFGAEGFKLLPFGDSGGLSALARDPRDGAVVAVGDTHGPGGRRAAIFRMTPAGDLDPAFDGISGSGDGKVAFGLAGDSAAADVAVDAQGRIVLTGWGEDAQGQYRGWIGRLLPDGRPDPSFGGGDGVTPFDGEGLGRVVPTSSGRIYAEGSAFDESGVLAAFTDAGEPDAGFGGGVVPMAVPGATLAIGADLVLQPTGKLLWVGYGTREDGTAIASVQRFVPSGALDPAFGTGGRTALEPSALAVGGTLDAQGRLVVSGGLRVVTGPNTTTADPLLARLEVADPAPAGGTGTGGTTPGGGTTPPAGGPALADLTKPVAKLKLAAKQRRTTLRRTKRLGVAVTLDEPGKVALTAKLTRKRAKAVTLATGTATFTKDGTRSVSLKLTKAGLKALRSRAALTLVLTSKATDTAGNAATRTVRKAVAR